MFGFTIFSILTLQMLVNSSLANQPERIIPFTRDFGLDFLHKYPTPINQSITLSLIPGCSSFGSLKVFVVSGREVATLVNAEKLPGEYQVEFSVHQAINSKPLSSGDYFYRLKAGDFVDVKKMVFMK